MPNIEQLNELSVAHLMHIPVNHNSIICQASDDKNENVAKKK